MHDEHSAPPRILILERDPRALAMLRGYTVKGWRNAAVQTMNSDLARIAAEPQRIRSFDVILASCDFSDGADSAAEVLRALTTLTADPSAPAVVLLTHGGSEYTAVQALRSGAADCVPMGLAGREQVVSAIGRAFDRARVQVSGSSAEPAPFGYQLLQRLANHDNVTVHRAFSAERCEEVVLKVLHRGRRSMSRDEHFQQFVDELKLLYEVDDPAVAVIHEFRATREHCYIVMEYFPLGHMGTRLGHALPMREALQLAAQIADSLAIVHSAGIVHRDLKPGNIMLRENGSIALIDFGISTTLQDGRKPESNADEPIRGTPYYMSPEQADGRQSDERCDLYALGVILFQMLTGHKPFTGDSPLEILQQHRETPLPDLADSLTAVGLFPEDDTALCIPALQALLDKLLAKDPEQRIARAREVAEALRDLGTRLEVSAAAYRESSAAG